jgi:hypothetical protein
MNGQGLAEKWPAALSEGYRRPTRFCRFGGTLTWWCPRCKGGQASRMCYASFAVQCFCRQAWEVGLIFSTRKPVPSNVPVHMRALFQGWLELLCLRCGAYSRHRQGRGVREVYCPSCKTRWFYALVLRKAGASHEPPDFVARLPEGELFIERIAERMISPETGGWVDK